MATPVIILFFLIFVGVLLRFALELIGLFVVVVCLFFAFGSSAHANEIGYYEGDPGGTVTLTDEHRVCTRPETDAFQFAGILGTRYGCWKESTRTTVRGAVEINWKDGTTLIFLATQVRASQYSREVMRQWDDRRAQDLASPLNQPRR